MGCINVPDKHFSYVTEHVHVAHAVVGSSGGGVGRGSVLTFLTSTSLMLRNMYTLRMLSYDHQGDGVGGVLTFLTGTFLTLRNKLPVLTCCTYFLTRFCWISSSSVVTADGARGFAASCVKDYPHKKGSRWPKSTTNKISLLRLIIFEVVCGVNPIEPLLLVLNKWMEHGNTSKNGDLCRCSTKRSTSVQKKVRLGLQLDMASQCCLVAVCGFCVATSALALKRREEEKNG